MAGSNLFNKKTRAAGSKLYNKISKPKTGSSNKFGNSLAIVTGMTSRPKIAINSNVLPLSIPNRSISNTNLQSKPKSKPINSNHIQNTSYLPSSRIIDDTHNQVNNATSSGDYSYGGGGASAPVAEDYAIDLTDILDAYAKSAQAQQQTIRDTTAATIKALQDSEASQRSTLSKALDRFREDTAKERALRQSNFNASRADLEAQAYMANRQAMQSAAARGIGGSGLQQLAQLQNLINQGNETSDLAQSNTDSLNALAQTLARQEQDTTTSLNELANNLATKIQNLNTNQANQINEIDKNTASLQNQLKYQEAIRAQDARAKAEQFAASLAAQNASTASNWELYNLQKQDDYNNLINTTKSGLEAALRAGVEDIKTSAGGSKRKNNENVKTAYKTALSNLTNTYAPSGLNESYLSAYKKELDRVFNQYYRV